MKKVCLILLASAIMLFTAVDADAHTLSGEIDGAVWFGGITYVCALSLEFVYPPNLYLGLAIFGNGSYSILNVPDGEYIVLAFQDRDNNMTPSTGDYYGFYGGDLPEIVEVTGNVSDLDITVAPFPETSISGTVTYQGSQTGLTLFEAATDPNFQNIAFYSILLDSTGNGEYMIFVDPGIYYVRAYIDLDLSISLTAGDPNGYYGFPDDPVAVDVTNSAAENIDLTIYDVANLAVTLEPLGAPIIIPPHGGSFDYIITLVNNGSSSVEADAWIDVVLPNGNVYGPVIIRTIVLAGGGQIIRTLTQSVPPNAPSGTYTYRAQMGNYPDIIYAEDSFEFEKSGIDDSGFGAFDWGVSVREREVASVESLSPTNCVFHSVCPNPFNPTTEISFNLAEASQVEIVLFDIRGRQVAQLAEGFHTAGAHSLTIDGSGMSSGIYFVRLVSGADAQALKVMLLK